MKYIIISILLISCWGEYPRLAIDDRGKVYNKNTVDIGYGSDTTKPRKDTMWIEPSKDYVVKDGVIYGEAGIYQPFDTAKYYWKQFNHFRNLANNTTGRKSTRYLDSTEKYYKLLYKIK